MISVYNTLSGKKEEFKPIEKGKIRMYVCGPTVYGPAHLGHARTYVAFDIIRRYLEFMGYEVKFVVNITDIHDDIIKRANELNINFLELTTKFTENYFRNMKSLKIKDASICPKVTDNIPEIIQIVKTLKDKGYAYETEDGVYFNVAKMADYGKLSHIKISKQKTGTRVETDKYEKEEARDFALWKKQKPNEPFWDSPFGQGRPGWHIECSALSTKYLGLQIDIHGGARDLIFPHHENEIAQSECCFGKKPFVKYWLHSGFLTVSGQKMSKSLGNYIVVEDLLKEYSAEEFRFFIAQSHYRSPINFSKEEMKKSRNALNGLNEFIQRLLDLQNSGSLSIIKDVNLARKNFIKEMDSDFNLPKAWVHLFKLESLINKKIAEGKFTKEDSTCAIQFFKDVDKFLQVFSFEKKEFELSAEEKSSVEKRNELRNQKKWEESDEIRQELLKKGIELDDTKEGTKWKRI
ncbi:MAG: cysteine--tRNA ligase [archaeon]